MSQFAKATGFTVITDLLTLVLGLGTSVILARVLGPEGRGIYTLATLLPAMIVTFGNLGIGTATVYYVARGEFRSPQCLGNNVLLSLGVGALGLFAGLVVILFFRETIFPGVAPWYLCLALVQVPLEIFFSYVRYVLLGAQRIKEFNYTQIAHSALFLGFVVFALLGLRVGVIGAILAGWFAWLFVDILVLWQAKTAAGGIEFVPNISYIKRAAAYGVQAHVASILGFLNYRVDLFLVNGFLGAEAVGLYAIGVGLAEKLWVISYAAGTVLFPRVIAESEEHKRKELTPRVARTVLWTTALGALLLAFLSHWIVLLLYSEAFLPAVGALRALLVGVVTLSVWRVMANDIAGRGFPALNIYSGVAAVGANVALNLLWIPRFGLAGAAWASTASYTVSFLLALFFYCRLSGNHWTTMVLPQPGDFSLYLKTARGLLHWTWTKARIV